MESPGQMGKVNEAMGLQEGPPATKGPEMGQKSNVVYFLGGILARQC